jgi:hypothetical protein
MCFWQVTRLCQKLVGLAAADRLLLLVLRLHARRRGWASEFIIFYFFAAM